MSIFDSFGQGDVWSITGMTFSSPLSDLLDVDNFTLEQILVEDELIQELKSRNVKLMEFLSHEDAITKLINYVTSPSDENTDDNMKFKFPFMSCEIICCEIPEILNVVINAESCTHIDALFSIISHSTSPDNFLAGYFEKILEVLFRTKTILMIKYVNDRGQPLFQQFLSHIHNYSIMQIVQRLLLPHIPFHSEAAPDSDELDKIQNQCQWSYQYETCQALVSMMVSSPDQDVVTHISDLIITIAQLSPADAPILKYICEPENLSLLWGLLQRQPVEGRDNTIAEIAVVSVLECVLSRLYETAASIMYDENGQPLLVAIKLSFQNILAGVKDTLPNLKASIEKSKSSSMMIRNQKKESIAMLGQLCFFYTKLVEGLLRLGDDDVDQLLCESGILNLIVDLIFRFPNHSMLHLSVQRILLVILEDVTHRMLVVKAVFTEYGLLGKIVSSLTDVVDVPIASRSPLIGHLVASAQAINISAKSQKDEKNEVDEESTAVEDGFNANSKQDTLFDVLDDAVLFADWEQFSDTILVSLSAVDQQSLSIEAIAESPALAQPITRSGRRDLDNDQDLDDSVDWYETAHSPRISHDANNNDNQSNTAIDFNIEWDAHFNDGNASSQAVVEDAGFPMSFDSTQRLPEQFDPFADQTTDPFADPFADSQDDSIDSLIT